MDAKEKRGRSWLSETGFEVRGTYDRSIDAATLGEPGRFPFVRHIYSNGYRDRPWAPSLYSGFGSAKDANQRFRYLLSQGNGRANIATDLPTQIGLDSDDPVAAAEVGRVGVAIDSLRDFEEMFDQVSLGRTTVSFNVNTVAPIFHAMFVATAAGQGVDPAALRGTIANDILHEYIARGTWRYPTEPSLRLMADLAEFSVQRTPKLYPFNLRSILLHEAGASPAQEIGISFAIAKCYIDEILARGLAIDEFAPKISFFFGAGIKFFEEASKFRAARRLWAELMRGEYGAALDESCMLRLTSVAPCGSHFSAYDPELNLVRGTLGCLSGALGGVQALLGTTIDEAFDIPTERTQELALRTQQIVAMESDVCATVDPLGGSYFVEAMTSQIESAAREEMAKLEAAGGVVEAIEAGFPQRALADRAYVLAREIADGTRPVVGENVFRSDIQHELNLHESDAALHETRAKGLQELRRSRDARLVQQCLRDVESAARSGTNVMPSLIAAVMAYATIGEISAVLEDVFGVYREALA